MQSIKRKTKAPVLVDAWSCTYEIPKSPGNKLCEVTNEFPWSQGRRLTSKVNHISIHWQQIIQKICQEIQFNL